MPTRVVGMWWQSILVCHAPEKHGYDTARERAGERHFSPLAPGFYCVMHSPEG